MVQNNAQPFYSGVSTFFTLALFSATHLNVEALAPTHHDGHAH